MNEAKFTTKLQKWLKHNWKKSYLAEVKFVEYGGKFYYNTWLKKQAHQLRNLKLCKELFLYKFSDFSQLGTPVDLVSLHKAQGYFIIQFYKRAIKHFYIINIEDIEKEINSGAIFLNEEIAKKICIEEGVLV